MTTTETHVTLRGETVTWISNGSKLASITEQADGTFRVACFIDYGQDGRSWCDGATYKTNAGALRKADGFTR